MPMYCNTALYIVPSDTFVSSVGVFGIDIISESIL